MAMREMRETRNNVTEYLERVPTQGYIGLAVGSILASALLYISGRRIAALFVGQWPATFATLGLVYKLLRPSHEEGTERVGEAGEGVREAGERAGEAARETAREIRSRAAR